MNADMSDKIIISYSSTAIITPKILLDQEPYIVILKLLVDGESSYGDWVNDFNVNCKELYRDKNRFFIPRSFEELDETIRVLHNSYID